MRNTLGDAKRISLYWIVMADILTLDEVRRLAELAKLELTDEEAVKYQKELSEVLDYFAVLDGVSTEDLKPTTQVTGLANVMRKDTITQQVTNPAELLGLSPKIQDQYIQVKRMI
jgi:aspartyl-tRNA(Asn)/glutamyl-tRNA(Gln) amidotransferase subunit C